MPLGRSGSTCFAQVVFAGFYLFIWYQVQQYRCVGLALCSVTEGKRIQNSKTRYMQQGAHGYALRKRCTSKTGDVTTLQTWHFLGAWVCPQDPRETRGNQSTTPLPYPQCAQSLAAILNSCSHSATAWAPQDTAMWCLEAAPVGINLEWCYK